MGMVVVGGWKRVEGVSAFDCVGCGRVGQDATEDDECFQRGVECGAEVDQPRWRVLEVPSRPIWDFF